MLVKYFYVLLLFTSLSSYILAQQGTISGQIFDAKTAEPLIGVNVIVNELKDYGAASDLNGRFTIKIPSGSYSLKASLVGYLPLIKTDVVVKSGSEAQIIFKMSETTLEIQQITVKADYFDKSLKENDLSTVILNAEEIRRSPGSAQDFQRILQAMPGVSFSNDQNNELLVRGGSPDENLTVFDGMEIHSTNHYPNEYNSGGPINMVNVDLIEDIQFSTGGFISKYGDKLSSVMNITTREGTRNSSYLGNLNLSMAGYGAVMEGSINNGKGSWLISARKSFLDLIKGTIGLTAVPKYYDLQFKIAYDLSSQQKLSMSGIYGDDRIFIEGESDLTKRELAGKSDSVGVEIVDVRQHQYASGISLKSLWSKSFYSMTTLYFTKYNFNIDVNQDFSERFFDNEGKLDYSDVLKRKLIFDDKHDNGEAALKTEFFWNVGELLELNFGGSVKTGYFKQDLLVYGDSARYDVMRNGWNTPDDITIKMKPTDITYDVKWFDHFKSYLFLNNKFKLYDGRMIVNLGLRYDHFTFSKKANVSPRISASFYLIPGTTNLNLAYGEFYQTQNYPTYGDRYKEEINRYLKSTHSRHFVAGLEHIFDDGLKASIEGYYKKYTDIPVSETFIHFNDRTFRSQKNLNAGNKTNYGIDLLVQQKLVKDLYGTLAYSRMWSKVEDPRIGKSGQEYSSEYEFPHVLTLIVGKRFAGMRDNLDDMPFFIKYPSYILPFSNDMEISLRWRYASGKVYTPKYFSEYEQHFEGDTRWSKGTWISTDAVNSARYPDYHRLDLAFNSRYNFSNWNLSVFLSLQNIYNRENVAAYIYNSDGTTDTVYQFAFLPVAGVEIEF